MPCFWWQFTNNITVHTIRLSLKESCLKINVKDLQTFAGCQLATHPKSRSCGIRRICLLMLLLFVLVTSQCPSGLCLEEVALFVCLDGEHPSSGHIISRFNLPHVDRDQKTRWQPKICTLDVLVQQTACSIPVLLERMFSVVHGISFRPLFLLPFRR